MEKKKWERKECDSCKSFTPECRQGACIIYPYKRKKCVLDREKVDTS